MRAAIRAHLHCSGHSLAVRRARRSCLSDHLDPATRHFLSRSTLEYIGRRLGNAYVSGQTSGSLGAPNAGSVDAFISKYDASGSVLWTRQIGTSSLDVSMGVSADALGNVYISGYTSGSLCDPPNAGGVDAFVSKYDTSGNLLWCRQLGSSGDDYSFGASADGLGNVYMSGYTSGSLDGPNAGPHDAFVTKYDAAGNLLWTRQLGTSVNDYSLGVSADGLGNVYFSGQTSGSLGGPNAGSEDAFLTKYDASGNLVWSRQLGTSAHDTSYDVSADGVGNAYISGYTNGSLDGPNAGGVDAFVSKYDSSGNLVWTRQLGTSDDDWSYRVSADEIGNAYVSGTTFGSLAEPNVGLHDAFVTKYDGSGNLLWTRQLGTSVQDASWGVSPDGLGNVYLSGYTYGSLGGPNAGGVDAWVARLSPVPEPSTLILAGVGCCVILVFARRRRETAPPCKERKGGITDIGDRSLVGRVGVV
jgi:hypothetical protein